MENENTMTLRDTTGLLSEPHANPDMGAIIAQSAGAETIVRGKDTTVHHLPTVIPAKSPTAAGQTVSTVPAVAAKPVAKYVRPPLNPGKTIAETGEITRKWRKHECVQDLLACLRFRRPKGGATETRFIREHLDNLPTSFYQDECGNIYTIVGQDSPTVLWSCHTDSVHRMEGEQAVVVDGDWIRLPENSKSNCLGADDMAGIWLFRNMIKAGVPGLYIFHYGEESGGIGSGYIADKHPEYLAGIQMAIAFDRRNFTDVITHQAGGRCCSDEFAESLAKLLPGDYKPSPQGIFTDTANYITLIPECTNVSVGYFDEHSSSERLNIPHILALRDSLCGITQADLDALVIKRDPKAPDMDEDDFWGMGAYGYVGGGRYGYRGGSGRAKERADGVFRGKYGGRFQHLGSAYDVEDQFELDDQPSRDVETLIADSSYIPSSMHELCEEFPTTLAKVLIEYGFSVDELWDEMSRMQERRR